MTAPESVTLLPCPFCGGEAECDSQQAYRALSSGRIGTRFAIYCTSCNADMGFCYEDIESENHEAACEEIIAAWNTRQSAEAASREREARLVEALAPFAAVAEHDIGEDEADSDLFQVMGKYNRAPKLKVGDFRRAALAALRRGMELRPELTREMVGKAFSKAASLPFNRSEEYYGITVDRLHTALTEARDD